MKKPNALRLGDTVGLVAPSRWAPPEWIEAYKNLLQSKGYSVKLSPQLTMRAGQLGGSDEERVKAIHDMFIDQEVRAVLCATGGTGAFRLLERLNFQLLAANPKIFGGFSDITTLLTSMRQRSGFVTFHAPLGWNFAHPHDPRTADDLFGVLTGQKTGWQFDEGLVLHQGETNGVLTGGNLSLLVNLIGTADDWSAADAMLVIEDTEEPLYKIDVMLSHLARAGKFKDVRAVLVGEMTDITDGEPAGSGASKVAYGYDLAQLLRQYIPATVPLAARLPFGHGRYLTTLPLGVRAKVSVSPHRVSLDLLEPAVLSVP